MHLDEINIFLEDFPFFVVLIHGVDFVANDNNWDAKVNLKHSFSKRHVKAHIHVVTHVRVVVLSVLALLKLFFVSHDQVAMVIQLRFFVRLDLTLYFLLHLLVGSHRHFGN